MQHQKEMNLPKLKIHCFDERELLALQRVQTELLNEYNAIRKARNKSLFRLFLNYIQHGKPEKMSYDSYLIGKLNVSEVAFTRVDFPDWRGPVSVVTGYAATIAFNLDVRSRAIMALCFGQIYD